MSQIKGATVAFHHNLYNWWVIFVIRLPRCLAENLAY